ncbi:MAG TPA: ArsI/CadI family heavy metal resistance metalloenzyme [Burkholderiales bacterium]|nr:ArsI/CadI family heavy metal resistance metalloenzyme [Burkholderiales bacterium]
MKRFHVHVAVDHLDEAVRFYSTMFGAPPTVLKSDYAKWMVEDPRINFAISARGAAPGVNHLGFQLDSDEEFRAMHAQLAAADAGVVEETGANCCYAKSDKYWVTDPAGVAWETYHTLASIPVFGAAQEQDEAPTSAACCTPSVTVTAKVPVKDKARAGCCS